MDRDKVKETTRKYWRSWQDSKWDDMEDAVSDDYTFYLFGELTPIGKSQLLEISKKGSKWKDVEMLSEVYFDSTAAIHYKGTSLADGKPVTVSEFLEFNEDGKIFRNHTMINPAPNFG